VKVTVKLFAGLKESVGSGKLQPELADGSTVQDLIAWLQSEYPDLEQVTSPVIMAVNQKYVNSDQPLVEGDEIALFPPVSGGVDRFRITHDAISPDQVIGLVAQPRTGAVASFVGLVRDESLGREVSFLAYEAYEEMAVPKMRQIADEARAKWPEIAEMAIVQRVGRQAVGEISIVIAVSSPHRGDGCFEACRYAIDRLKEIVPIWKMEVGPDGRSWVEGEYRPTAED